MKQDSGRSVVITVLAVLMLGGCGALAEPASRPVFVQRPNATQTSATATPTSSRHKLRNDLQTGRKEHVVKSGRLIVKVKYSTTLRTVHWTPKMRKPLDLKLTAFVDGMREQKVYLSALTLYATASDNSGPVSSPDALKDRADIRPGYLVTSPESYTQSFVLPAVDDGATALNVDLHFEFLIPQGQFAARDYSKRTAKDSLTVPLN
jgi:hypothetical protein